MALIAARLRRDGRPTIAVNYPSMATDAEAKAAFVAQRIRDVAAQTARRVDVVAHSLGGVVLRAAALSDDVGAALGNVVTLGSPHRGAALALLWGGAGLAPMRPGSAFLEGLARCDRLVDSANVTAIATSDDAIVFPIDLAYYAGALNVTIENVGHHGLLFSQRVYDLVRENLDAPPRERLG
jgi:triacylglycerol esterase/lipase EstA (alpha/beta hydrolase family)